MSATAPTKLAAGELILTPAIFAAMSAVMGDVGHIAKTRKNTTQGYSFRGIDEIYSALQGPLVKHGVFCVPQVMEKEVVERNSKNGGTLIYTSLKVRHVFYAKDGSSVEAITVGEAMDSGDKSSNKAMSAALKYAMLEVFCIPTEGDNDSENDTHEVAPRQQTTGERAAQQQAAAEPRAKSAPERYDDVCETIKYRMGIGAGSKYIREIREMYHAEGPDASPKAKMDALLALEGSVKELLPGEKPRMADQDAVAP